MTRARRGAVPIVTAVDESREMVVLSWEVEATWANFG